MDQYRMIESKDVSGFLLAFLSFVKQVSRYIMESVKKYFVLALIVFTIISASGLYFLKVQKPQYEVEMVCAFNNLSKKVYGEMILKLDQLLQSRSYPALAKTLNLPIEQVQHISSIKAKNIAGSPLHEDINTDQTPFYVAVKSGNKEILQPLQYSLLTYLNNASPFRKRRNMMEMEIIGTKMKFLSRDMHQTDSIISAYTNFLKRTRSVTDSAAGFSNIAAMMTYKNELEDKRVQQEWRMLELENSVEILHGFIIPDNPAPKRSFLWFAIPFAFLMSLVIPVLLNLLLLPQNAVNNITTTEENLQPEPVSA